MKTNTNVLAFVFLGLSCLGAYLLFQQWGTLTTIKKERDGLRDTTNLLVRLILKKDETIATLTREKAAGQLAAAQSQEKIRKAVADKKQAIAQLSTAQVKLNALRVAFQNGDITAARLRDSLSAMPVFTEEQANRKYLELVAERDMWRDSSRVVYEQLGRERERSSELEDELNHVFRDVTDLRTEVQDRRAKKSKGVVRRIVNGGQIQALGEVDARLQATQAKLRRP